MKNIKRISKIVLVAFVFNMFAWNTISVQAATQTPIVGQATASVAQMQKWARSKGATNTFVSLAPKYMELASRHGGINPVVAYAQSAVETGYGHFGGVINESYHNPCGLKTKEGGDNSDPNAHQRFANWDQGISAHLDHLALYAGANGYPRSNTYDPRHFPSIKGKAVYVEQLSGAWATDKAYAGKILKLKDEIENIKSSVIYVDHPNGNIKTENSVMIKGWTLDNTGIKDVKVYVDGKYDSTLKYGVSRPDVNAAYPGYVEGSKSGFEGSVNMTKYSVGKHNLKVEATAKDGTKVSTYRTVERTKKKSLMFIDNPANGTSGEKDISINGWVLDSTGINTVKVYVDGKYDSTLKYGNSRPDVNSVYPGYIEGKQSGFQGKVDLSKYSPGKHTIKIEAVAKDGTKISAQKNVSRIKKQSLMMIDNPVNNLKSEGKVSINGWVLDNTGIQSVKLYMNGKYDSTLKYGISRPDVNAVYPGYVEGAKSGFKGEVDLSNYQSGRNVLRVEAIAKDGTKIVQERTVEKPSKQSLMNLDSPKPNSNVKEKFTINGWVLDSSGIKDVKVYVDGKYDSTLEYGISRPDVNEVYPGYVEGSKSGFKGTIDFSKYIGGTHKVKVEATANNGKKVQITTNINRIKDTTRMNIETPSINQQVKNSVRISGWILDSSGIKDVKVYMDGKYDSTLKYGISRPDVNEVYPGYVEGSKSGFSGEVDMTKYSGGNHEVKIVATSKDGSKVEIKRNIMRLKKVSKMNVDSPNQGQIIEKQLTVSGWALNDSGIKSVRVYLNNKLLGTAKVGISRPDVNVAYPGYYEGSKSGFKGTFNTSDFSNGIYTMKIEAIGEDGSKQYDSRSIRINGKKVVVLDPGHSLFGVDSGASATHNGITYNEGELDLQLAMKAKKELEEKGFNVVMTQTLGNMISADTAKESLRKRVEIAEANNADLFVSIHHNSYTSSSAHGTEVWYSNPKKNPKPGATRVGQELAGKVAKSIASRGGFYNRGSKENDWYVTYNTTMPSILVEAGFLTNPNDAKKAASSSNQQKVAEGMADTINSYMN